MVDSMLQLEAVHPPSFIGNGIQWHLLVPLFATAVIACLSDWLWWKYNIVNLSTIPTTKCNRHVFIASSIYKSLFKNKLTDANVLFFQLLQGFIKVHQHQNQGLFYMWTGFRPVVVIFSPEIFEAILKSQTNLQKSFDYTFLKLWLKEGLVTSYGNKWRNRRRAINGAFHHKILVNFISVFDKQSRYMVKKLEENLNKSDCIDMTPYVTMCTLDIICETAMGFSINAQDNKDTFYLNKMHKACEGFVGRVFRPWLWPNWIFFNSSRGKEFAEATSSMDKFTRQVILDKKAEKIEKMKNGINEDDKKRKAFLDMLLDMHLSDPKGFTEYDIQEEVDSFMFAGHDTTAVGTSWILYLLGLHQDIQNRVLDEMDAVYGDDIDKPVSEEDLKELKYLDMVIKETQRLFPPAPYIGRQLQEDVEVNGYRIPKGTTCMLVIYMLHRDPNTFPNPEKFDPDRFLPENCAERHPYAHVPFSAGPRSCIGQRFAVLEEKTILSNILRRYRVETVEKRDKLFLASELVLRSRGGIKMRLIPRR